MLATLITSIRSLFTLPTERIKTLMRFFRMFGRRPIDTALDQTKEQPYAPGDKTPDQGGAIEKKAPTDSVKSLREKWKLRSIRILERVKPPNKKFLVSAFTIIALLMWFPQMLLLIEQKRQAPDPQSLRIAQLLREKGLLLLENTRIKQDAKKYLQQLNAADSVAAPQNTLAEKQEQPAPPPKQISLIFPNSSDIPSEDCSIKGKADIREVLKRCIDAYNALSK